MYRMSRLRTALATPKPAEPFTRLQLRRHVLVWLLLGGMIGCLVAWGLWAMLGRPAVAPSQPGTLTPIDIFDGIKIALTVVGGIGAVIVLVVVYRHQVYNEREHAWAADAAKRADVKVYTERFGSAADQLGSDKTAVRLAGAYAMASLADDWQAGQQTCIDVLCAYIRMPYEPPGAATGVKARGQREEQQVRDTIIKLISAHLRDAAAVSWQGRDLDFGGAVFDSCDFSGARFTGGSITFSKAKFTGEVIFAGARFNGGGVYFSEAEFTECDADFTWAQFNGGSVYFARTQFTSSRVRFTRAQVTAGDIYFGEAQLSASSIYFGGASFAGGAVSFAEASFANGSDAHFEQARFATGAKVSLGGALFAGGEINFGGAELRGGQVDFTLAKFTHGAVRFDGAQFSGSEVDFSKARFAGGSVDISHPSTYEVPPTFTWTTQPEDLRLPTGLVPSPQRTDEPTDIGVEVPSSDQE